MKTFIKIILSSAFLFLTACAVGPLVVHETARTVGDTNHELDLGYGSAGYLFKWNYGLTENWDLGLQLEALSIGLRGKYAFLNAREKGWSLAAALGVGSSIGGSHYYGDILASYLAGSWEPYTVFRIVHVKTDPIEFEDEDTGDEFFTINAYKYDYGQFVLGTRYWFNKHWLLSLEGSTLFSYSSAFVIEKVTLVGAALGYKFE